MDETQSSYSINLRQAVAKVQTTETYSSKENGLPFEPVFHTGGKDKGKSIISQWEELPTDNAIMLAVRRFVNREALLGKRFIRPSVTHGRSMLDSLSHGAVVWGDSYGNLFGSFDEKGSIMHDIVLKDDPYNFNQLAVMGLKDSITLERILRASELMRSLGLPTERISHVRTLQEVFTVFGQKMTIKKWKRGVINHLAIDFRKERREPNFIQRAIEYFQHADFVLIERETQTAVRIKDVVEMAQTQAKFEQLMSPVFAWLRAVKASGKEVLKGVPIPEKLDVHDSESIQKYFTEWLPKMMGTYLARMHNNGLSHGFASTHNFTAVGNLIDTDSVTGNPLGDKPIGTPEIQRDLYTTRSVVLSFFGLYQRASKTKDTNGPYFLSGRTYVNNLLKGQTDTALRNFEQAYNHEITPNSIAFDAKQYINSWKQGAEAVRPS